MEDLYCKIYVNTDMSKEVFLDFIAKTVNGSIELRTVVSPIFEVDVVNNQEADPLHAISPDDGFLYYPYYLDVEPKDNFVRDAYVVAIAMLLIALRNIGAAAVAACDFEDELPVQTSVTHLYRSDAQLATFEHFFAGWGLPINRFPDQSFFITYRKNFGRER